MNNKIIEISKLLSLHPKIVEILVNRGIDSLEEIDSFINLSVDSLNIAIEHQMVQNVIETIDRCIKNDFKIILYGDADMDGISSTSILYKSVTTVTRKVEVILTEKVFSSYGVNLKLIEDKVDNKTLLIFLDLGTSDIDMLEELKSKTNCEIIIIDHHESLDRQVDKVVILNPKSTEFKPISLLTSSGLAALLSIGLLSKFHIKELDTMILELFEIASLGIIADLGKLTGINRTIVKLGLKSLANPVNKSLSYLLKNETKLFNDISITSVAFRVIPRFNACCRMGYPKFAFDFLTEIEHEKIKKLSEILNQFNEQRRQEEQKIFSTIDNNNKNYVILYDSNWHPGIISSVSTRLSLEAYKPTLIMTKVGNTWKGSARFPGGNILDILSGLSDILIKFGGHKEASGFEVDEKNFNTFIKRLEDVLKKVKITKNNDSPDVEIKLDDVNVNFINNLRKLEPFGIGFPTPIFNLKEANVYSVDESDDNLIIFLYNNGRILKGVAPKSLKKKLPSNQVLQDIICKIHYTNFNENFVENELFLAILDFQ